MAAVHDITIDQGATWQETITWQRGDGQPRSEELAGASALMQIRAAHGSPVLVEVSSPDGIEITAASGTLDISLDAAATAGLAVRHARYDLLVTVGGTAWRIVEGRVTVRPAISDVSEAVP